MTASPELAIPARGSVGARPRLAIFTTHPIQYQAPLFRELALRAGVEPVVLFGSRHGLDLSLDKGFGRAIQWDIPLLDGYAHRFVENVARRSDVDRITGIRVRDAKEILRAERADAVLVLGWQTVAHFQFMRAARALGLPLFVRGESNLLRRLPSGPKALLRSALWLPLREVLYRALFATVAEFLVIGTRNAEFYRHFGVPARKLRWAPYAVDNARFALPAGEARAARAEHRLQLGIASDAVVFIASAKLLPRKRPFDLLAAFAAVAGEFPQAHLVYLGDGPLREELDAETARLGLTSRVSVTGFVNQQAIPGWYAAADCVVLPSDSLETWGLAVNEGMAAGLAAIVSDQVGCAPDLVQPTVNGYRFPCGDVGALAARLRDYLRLSPAERDTMAQRSREIVAGFTTGHVADAIAAAVAEHAPSARKGHA